LGGKKQGALWGGFLPLANGFNQTLKGSGAPDVAIALRDGSAAELNSVVSREQIDLLGQGPGVRAGPDGRPLISAELVLIVDGIKKSTGTKANMPLRGIGPNGLLVRPQAKITQGRMFTPGSNEIVVGAGLLREFSGFELGKTLRFGAQTWKVVGVFEAPGTVFESELWADAPVIQSLFKRGSTFQTARIGPTRPGAPAGRGRPTRHRSSQVPLGERSSRGLSFMPSPQFPYNNHTI